MASEIDTMLPVDSHTIEIDGEALDSEVGATLDKLSEQVGIRRVVVEFDGEDVMLSAVDSEGVEDTDEIESGGEETDTEPSQDDINDLDWNDLRSMASDYGVYSPGKDADELREDIRTAKSNEPEPTSSDDGDVEAETKADDSEDIDEGSSTPRLHSGKGPHVLVWLLREADSWVRTKRLQEAVSEELDISGESVQTNLTNLENRGLVEKRPYEEDKRQNEYSITDLGREALEESDDGSFEPPELDLEELPDTSGTRAEA